MANGEQDRGARARGRAADERGHGAELLQQHLQIVGPGDLLDLVAIEQNFGGAGVAPVVQQHAIAAAGDLRRERNELVVGAPAAGDQRHPGAAFADDLIVDVDATDFFNRHSIPPTRVSDLPAPRAAATVAAKRGEGVRTPRFCLRRPSPLTPPSPRWGEGVEGRIVAVSLGQGKRRPSAGNNP